MNHSEVRASLLLYIDGELPKDISSHVDAHLRDCAECRHDLDMTRSLWSSEILLSSGSEPYSGWMRLRSRIESYNRHTILETIRPSLPVALRVATVSALICCALLFGKYLGDTAGILQAGDTNVIGQLHLDKFQLPESDPLINTMLRFNNEFEKWGKR